MARFASFDWTVAALQPARRVGSVLLHVALWVAAFWLALCVRFDGAGWLPPGASALTALFLLITFRVAFFYRAGLFAGLYRYSGMPELAKLVASTTAATAAAIAVLAMLGGHGVPSLFLGEWLASLVVIGGLRMGIRSLFEMPRRERRRPGSAIYHGPERRKQTSGETRTLIIGAGDAAESLLRDLARMRDGAAWRPVALLDDDPRKIGRLLRGLRVEGPADEPTLRRLVARHEVRVVVLAIPSAPGARVRELVQLCRDLGLQIRTVPSLAERMSSGHGLPALREVAIEDLLHRAPAQLDLAQVALSVAGEVVLVTGAGGSIGSELSRQTLRMRPRRLILLDHNENALFYIERELRGEAPDVDIVPVLGDITDEIRIRELFAAHSPAIVLHAAAHKHVGMLEGNAPQAARNNVLGTLTLARAAHEARARAVVLISTDKAVNPSSVMGATKRVAEMVVQHFASTSETRFNAVRFGNVLDSAGSVVPLFRAQIAAGGPVTVTHPDVRRYFMTIPEASQLVLQASALGGTGQIFLLDMGEPILIADLARDLIELSGRRPGVDIQIAFTELKPGEKLSEETLLADEAYDNTSNPSIVIGRIRTTPKKVLEDGLSRLASAISDQDDAGVRAALSALVPEARLQPPASSQERKAIRKSRREPALRIVGDERGAFSRQSPTLGSVGYGSP